VSLDAVTATEAAATSTGSPQPATGSRAPRTRNQRLARGAIGVAIALIAAMWVYAFVFADDSAVAKIADTSWTKRAEKICERRNDLLDANSKIIRETTDGSPEAVGRGVSRATDIIEATLDEVLAVTPPAVEDQKLIGEWVKLYRIYIADRRATEVKLANGEKAELNETTLNGSPISDSIGDFTKPNRMDACSVPSGS
jgi:hypothetical protein